MNAFKRKGRTIHAIKVPRPDGSWATRSTKTRDKATAKQLQAMVDVLVQKDEIALLWAWPLHELGRRWRAIPARRDEATGKALAPSDDERILALHAALRTTDLSALVDTWATEMAAPAAGVSRDNARKYVSHVRTLIPADVPFLSDALTKDAITAWLGQMTGSPSTVRRRGIALRRFIAWLRDKGHLHHDPMRDVKLPAQAPPRIHYLETHEAERLADAQPEPYATLSALLAGTGIDVSVALNLRVRDIDAGRKEIRAKGTKTYTRDRIARVADWAWPRVVKQMRRKLPDAKLFPNTDRWRARDAHVAAVKMLSKEFPVYRGYWMRDARHTYAVRQVRSGVPLQAVADQLGHANTVLVSRIYGRFVPTHQERDRYEAMATARDKARAKERGS